MDLLTTRIFRDEFGVSYCGVLEFTFEEILRLCKCSGVYNNNNNNNNNKMPL